MRNLVIALSAVLGLLVVSLIVDQRIMAGPARPPVRGAVYGYCTAAGCSGTLLGPNGTSSLPAFSFISDPDTGMYRSSADVLGFSAGGGPRMTIDSSGIYGIPFYSSANGTAGAPRFSWQSDTDTGLYRSSDNVMGISGGADAKMTFGATINSDIPIDFEGYASIGNGSAVAATETLIVDRDFSTVTTGSQLSTGGIITITGGTSSVPVALIAPQGVVLNDGGPGVHPVISSLEVRESVITETVGTCTTSAVYYAPTVASECDNNYSFHSAAGHSQLDGTLAVGTGSAISAYANSSALFSHSDSASSSSNNIGAVAEAAADGSRVGIGLFTSAKTLTTKGAYGVWSNPQVNAGTDSGAAYAFYGTITDTHGSGENIGIYLNVTNGSANHAISINAGDMEWNGKTIVDGSGTDGNLLITNNAKTGFGLLQAACTANTCPAWKRSGVNWIAQLADDSAKTDVFADEFTATTAVTSQLSRTKSAKNAFTDITNANVESVTFPGGGAASAVTVGGLILDGCFLLGISTYVTTADNGGACTGYKVGDGADDDIYGIAAAESQGTTTAPASATADVPPLQWDGPHEVTITGDGGNCIDMVVRITAHCIMMTADTAL